MAKSEADDVDRHRSARVRRRRPARLLAAYGQVGCCECWEGRYSANPAQIVGLKGEDAERLDKEEPGWKISGKYAVILLVRAELESPGADAEQSDGNKGEKVG